MPGEKRFEHQQLAIKRLCKADGAFAALWSDYEDALRARDYWKQECSASAQKADEYASLVEEMTAEIETKLENHAYRARPDPATR